MTTTEFKNSIKRELKEVEEMFKMGLLTPRERFEQDFEINRRLKMWFNLSS